MADRKKSGLSRREMLKRAGFTAAGAGFVPASALAQQAQPHEHQHKAQGDHKPAGPYERKYFNEHEFKTLQGAFGLDHPTGRKIARRNCGRHG